MRCPTAERLAEYVDVVRRTARAEHMVLHIVGCQRCSGVVSAVIQDLAKNGGAPGRRDERTGQGRKLRLVVPSRPKPRTRP